MDFLANIPSWDDIERNLDHKFGALNQSIDQGLQSANDGWDGMSRRVSNGVSQAYGYIGGARIDHLQQAMALSYPIVLDDLTRKLASINITEILPVLLKLVREVVMIMGGSVAVGAGIGGAVGSLAFGAGALPGAAVGGSIGLEVGNIILMALGLASIAEYFCQGAAPCAMNLYHGVVTAWHAEDGLKPPGLDPTGGSAAMIQERTERAARQLASGQEQLVLLLLTAIVAFLMGRYSWNAGESVATRSFRLRSEITNKEFAEWLARNEQELLKLQELQPKKPAQLVRPPASPEPQATQSSVQAEAKNLPNGSRTRLPRTRGKWGPDGQGIPGESNWYSQIPAVNEITGGRPIPFSNGRPDFSEWSKGVIEFEPGVLDGSQADFKAVYLKIQEAKGLDSPNAAKQLLRQLSLTPHHLDSETIQLIPSSLHGNIPHIGSASDLRIK
ncbi:DUF6861 domain-containing protein [Pseudomonas graminis]|uniref:A nuclease of the HNH/ENDO VII superfamily with conserved WHH n=1 Tax=Pseudomonas graminis TaxID=158627 RepID=A0A1I0D5F1_9PSED|nr:HNH endonuclease [Pseudomonas graminis]SET27452.1 A nuclease of the HNH/ENDO VII superfamily with conserved WHH [Pseudomonas graminis]